MDLIQERLAQREVLEEGDYVGEGFVEGENVRVGRLDEAAVQAVEQRVRGLVRDDVVGECSRTPFRAAAPRPAFASAAGK